MPNTFWNPTDKTAGITLSNGNLTAASSASSNAVRAVDRQITGKFYWETIFTTVSTVYGFGAALGDAALSTMYTTPSNAVILYASGQIWVNGVNSGVTLGSVAGVTACVALDVTNRLFWARSGAAGNWNNSASANPATGVGGVSLNSFNILATLFPVAVFGGGALNLTANFGDSAFVGAVPSGFTSGFPAGATITNNLNIGGLARESLVSSPGVIYLGGLVRETLVGGAGLVGRITSRSSARGVASVAYYNGRITTRSSANAELTIAAPPSSAQQQYAVSIVI